jgi:anthranilate/para-aminobenzoate synthase component I
VRLGDLADAPPFALLGPGFGGAPFLLLEGLCAQDGCREPALVFAPFEAEGARALVLGAEAVRPAAVELDGLSPRGEIRVGLEAPSHTRSVELIREAIARGDVYQVCLTVRARLEGVTGAELLARMCRRGVPRFAAWVRLPGGEELVSASPELFFEVDGARVHAEPMKGTARPGAAGALEASEKDRAELAMITDLLRNDLAPVCRPGTVRVENERRAVELPYAIQTVSDVVGLLAPTVTPLDVLAALHPGGSVTGAPKRAALEMIRALEDGPRGAYCGALGLTRGARSVFSLLIRTAARSAGGTWVYGAGGGIVFDSDPRAELDEIRVKLGALL